MNDISLFFLSGIVLLFQHLFTTLLNSYLETWNSFLHLLCICYFPLISEDQKQCFCFIVLYLKVKYMEKVKINIL